jgi:hypothetical protein
MWLPMNITFGRGGSPFLDTLRKVGYYTFQPQPESDNKL